MKKLFCRCLPVILILLLALPVSAGTRIPEPTRDFFVNDFAGVIDEDDAFEMQCKGEELYAKCKAQVVVVTVDSLEGEAIEDLSFDIARSWGIGDKEKDNGVLLLLSVDEPHVRIEVGSGLEGALPDSKAGRLLDTYMMPNYTPLTFSKGLADTYDAIINEVYIEYGFEPDGSYTPIEEDEDSPLGILIALGILVFLIIITRGRILVWLFLSGRGGGFSGGGFSGGGGGFSGGGGGFSGGGASR